MPEIEPKDTSLKSLKGLHLWHAPMSSCSQRVRLVLEETGQEYVSHLVQLEKDEHATPEYQRIHPKGVVPALVDDGRLFIESIDIIGHLSDHEDDVDDGPQAELLELADVSQADLKLLTFEFLFRAHPPKPPEAVAKFRDQHENEWLKQFKKDFAAGFGEERINKSILNTDEGFRTLDSLLSDGRTFLLGDNFSLCDIAWIPNVHRMSLMDWPFERTPHLKAWFEKISKRPSYQNALIEWQNESAIGLFESYTKKRQSEGTDIRSYPALAS